MPPTVRRNVVLVTIGFLASFSVAADGFQREKCLDRVRCKTQNESSTLSPEWFWGANGMNKEYPVVSLLGCYKLCTGHGRWYFDAGQRLMTWLLPVVLLVGNLDVSTLDK